MYMEMHGVVVKMIGFVGQDIFPVGYDFHEKLPWRDVERCLLHDMIKDFIRLFGNADDFVWPKNEIESEPVPAMDQIRTNQSAYSSSSGSSRSSNKSRKSRKGSSKPKKSSNKSGKSS